MPCHRLRVVAAGRNVPAARSQLPGPSCPIPAARSQLPGPGCPVPAARSRDRARRRPPIVRPGPVESRRVTG